MKEKSVKVAVIGAGAAGLVTARELHREGHRVTVYERANRVGGMWIYDPRVEADPLGLDPNREIVHSSLYPSLRVNLPRQLMGFLDYPFLRKETGDPRSFPGHEEVARYFEDFARDFDLVGLIRFGQEVIRVERVDGTSHEWVVEWRTRGTESKWESEEEVFEAVVVCNGKHTEPRIAEFPGWATWPGIQIHSHNYRAPDLFQDQIECAQEDGKVVFKDGSTVYADAIIHCTGYKFHFPFLRTGGIVSVEDNRVGPLYKHVFPPRLAPWLSFIGLPFRAVPTLVFELQAKWVAKVFSGKLELPIEEEMASSVEQLYRHLEETGWPKHHTHKLQQDTFEYESWLVTQLELPPLGKWREQMYFSIYSSFYDSDDYRDTCDVDKWIQEPDP